MKIASLPANEQERFAVFRKYNILDTEPEAAFESMVQLASYICQTPIATISLLDEYRQWFKAIVGLDAEEASRDVAFCAHTVARMGGDEFTVILSQITVPIYAGKVAVSIIQKLTEPFIIGGEALNVSASMGITIYPEDGDNPEHLLENADIAMYAAKNSGRGRFSYFANPT